MLTRGSVISAMFVFLIGFAIDILADDGKKDIRLLIDVSNSMYENDKENVRAKALVMLGRILPEGTRSGAWMFDGEAKTLIPVGIVSKRWKKKLSEYSQSIHSNGEYTNIAEALEVGTRGWTDPVYNNERNMILLTDGYIDVSDDTLENDESKAHILDTLLPKYQNLGIIVHTVGLSKSADRELLRTIALKTGGLYSEIEKNANIQNVFLDIFDKTLLPSGIAIEENLFKVDKNIKEMILLIFRPGKIGSKKRGTVKLRDPNGRSFDKKTAIKNISWFEEGLTDLVVIKQPVDGEWKILGSIDPNNRALVISDLELIVNDLPANLYVGEYIDLKAKMMQGTKHITNLDFLNMINITTELNPGTKQSRMYSVRDNGKGVDLNKDDGIYTVRIGPLTEQSSEVMAIETVARGRTFNRVKRQTVHLLPLPFSTYFDILVNEEGKTMVEVVINPDKDSLSQAGLGFSATVADNQGKTVNYNIKRFDNDSFKLTLDVDEGVDKFDIKFKMFGRTEDGRDITLETEESQILVPAVTLPEPEIIERVVEVPVYINQSSNKVNNMDGVDSMDETQSDMVADLMEPDTDIQNKTLKSTSTEMKEEPLGFFAKLFLFIMGLIFNAAGVVGIYIYLKNEKAKRESEILSMSGKIG